MKKNRFRIIVATVLFIVVISAVCFGLWRFVFFNLISMSPSDGIVGYYNSSFVFNFNKDISSVEVKSITPDGVVKEPTIEGRSVVFKTEAYAEMLEIDSLNISFRVTSSNNKTIDIVRSYGFEFVDFENIDKKVQQELVDESSGFEDKYTLLSSLPYWSEDYEVDYRYPETGDSKAIVYVICKSSSRNLSEKSCMKEVSELLKPLGYDERYYRLMSYPEYEEDYLYKDVH